ncbi:MAG: agmatinase [Methanoregula sp.]|nr:MAG: agmatinase [Methanoregula sp.]
MQNFKNSLFANCVSGYTDASYVLFGVPYDSTTTFKPGTRDGPRAIREYSYNFERYMPAFDLNFNDIPVTDLGDIDTGVMPEDVVADVFDAVQEIIRDKKIPVMLGGEHSITTGAVRAVQPDCYVVCDAHLDLRDEFRGTRYNHACTTRRILDDGVKDIIIVGGRSGTKDQFDLARSLTLYTADEIHRRGMDAIVTEIKDAVRQKRVYLSIDADAIDCCLTPGLGTPEPFGLTPQDVRDIILTVAPRAVAFDYVEVSPFDCGQTATVAAQLVREFIAAHSKFST